MNQSITKSRIFKNVLKLLHMTSAICVTGSFLCMLIILMGRDMSVFTGNEIVIDKINLVLFNTLVTYGSFLMAATIIGYSVFTEWGFFKYRFLILKWCLTLAIVCVAYFGLGSAISGMASISDAGFQMNIMKDQYCNFWNRAVWSLVIEIILLLVTVFISIRKPFGKRDTKPFKYRKVAVVVFLSCTVIGVIAMICNSNNLLKVRKMPIRDIDLSTVQDGTYEGISKYNSIEDHIQVTVKDHQIVALKDLNPRDSVYAQYATGVFSKIITAQTPNVDAVSGATSSSKSFMKAVENALDQGQN